MSPPVSLLAYRFGLGLPLASTAPTTPEAMLERLTGPDHMAKRWPIAGLAEIVPLLQGIRKRQRKAKTDKAIAAEMAELGSRLSEATIHAPKASFARLLDSDDGFRERLVAFWADHFTVVFAGTEGVPLGYAMVEDAIRRNLAQPFGALLQAVVFQPAMLGYLDQSRSVGPHSRLGSRRGLGLNENFARELLELHTLGVEGRYTQQDVRQLAELLTGLRFDILREGLFDPKRVEPGPEVVLGQSYEGEGDAPIRAVLADLAVHPDTARHISRKLAVHFLSDSPDDGVVKAMEEAWLATGGDLLAVYRALLGHPASWAAEAMKVRQPYEFVVAGLRALGVTGEDLMTWDRKRFQNFLFRPLNLMGQTWKVPRGPDGWPEEAEVWVTPQALAARIGWAMSVPSRLVKPLPAPVDLARLALDDRASPALLWAAERAENRAEGVGLVLSSPEFNRR